MQAVSKHFLTTWCRVSHIYRTSVRIAPDAASDDHSQGPGHRPQADRLALTDVLAVDLAGHRPRRRDREFGQVVGAGHIPAVGWLPAEQDLADHAQRPEC